MSALILDPKGRPARRVLTREDDDVLLGLRTKRYASVIAQGLTPEGLKAIFTSAAKGNYTQFLTLAGEIEKFFPQYRSILQKRKLAALKRKCTVVPASEDSRDQFIAEELQELVDSPQWFSMSLAMLDAINRGYSVVEMIWDFSEGGAGVRFKWRDPRDFAPDLETQTYLKRKIPDTGQLVDLPFGKYAVHRPSLIPGSPVDGALAFTASLLYIFWALGMADYGDFIERFGTPAIYATTQNETNRDVLMVSLREFARAGHGVLPLGSEVKTLDAARLGGGERTHEVYLRYIDEHVSKITTGETMSMDPGSSRAQAQVHDEEKDDGTDYDAMALSMTQHMQIADAWRQFNYPDAKTPLLIRPGDDEDDIKTLADVAAIIADHGGRVPERFLLDRLGVGDVAKDEKVLEPASTGDRDLPGAPTRFEDAKAAAQAKGQQNQDGARDRAASER